VSGSGDGTGRNGQDRDREDAGGKGRRRGAEGRGRDGWMGVLSMPAMIRGRGSPRTGDPPEIRP
jgi:hypothetical protein